MDNLLFFLFMFAFLLVIGLILWQAVAVSRQHANVSRTGVPTVAAIVHANHQLFQAGSVRFLPALAIFCLDEGIDDPVQYLAGLVQRMVALKNTRPADADDRFVADLVRDERDQIMCKQLPSSFTGGPAVYATVIAVDRRCLPLGYLTEPYIRCKALPGPKGGAQMLPLEEQMD